MHQNQNRLAPEKVTSSSYPACANHAKPMYVYTEQYKLNLGHKSKANLNPI